MVLLCPAQGPWASSSYFISVILLVLRLRYFSVLIYHVEARLFCLKHAQLHVTQNTLKLNRSTEGCSKLKSPETRQVQERLVSTLEHM